MRENLIGSYGFRGCLVEMVAVMLTTGFLLVLSASYRNYGDSFSCNGGLGVGFPVSYLCDYGTGGSPISSWGKIDLADFPYISTKGLLIDLLFFSLILWVGWLMRRLLHASDMYSIRNIVWILLIGMGFLIGFLSAATIYKSDRINFQDYLLGIPTPVPATPTPFGTPPPPAFTPIPTAGP